MSEPRAAELAELSRLLAETGTDYGSVLRALTQRVSALIGDGCLVELIDRDEQTLRPVALYHPDPVATELACRLARGARSTVGSGVTGGVAATGQPAFFPAIDPAALRAVVDPGVHGYLDRFPVCGAIAVPLRAHGGAVGVLSVWRDREARPYTDDDVAFLQRLADHAALAIVNARLYGRLARAHAELATRTEQLQVALAELESFSYAVSHDLQVPLRSVRTFIEVFLDDHGAGLPEAGRELLGRVTDAADRMKELIVALLDLARVSSTEIWCERQDVSAIAAEVVAELRAAFPERAVRVDIQSGICAECDGRLLRIALQNLLSNAWKFTAGTPDASVWITGGDDPERLVLEVRDNGVGFDMAHARRLFTPFERLHDRDAFPGLGIGLATVARIARRHGGHITATSAPGQGATFRLELVRRMPPATEELPVV